MFKKREPERIDTTLALIDQIWKENPDLRLGQLILNAFPNGYDLYNMEEIDLYRRLRTFYYKTCGCGFKSECVIHCNHEAGLCPGDSFKPS